jgi:6-pyruvoyltetrahydropterin/6-carboxytetrahydropterin synthase
MPDLIRVAKDFRWEMSHRLPFHESLCKNVHGHSYKMRVELAGELNQQEMVLDYYDMKQIVMPLIEMLDHSFICDESDLNTIEFLEKNDMKYQVISSYTTVENIVSLAISELMPGFKKFSNIKYLKVRVHETLDTFAEKEVKL